MEYLLEGGVSDLVSMGRPFIREPDLILKLKSGEAKKAIVYPVIYVLILRGLGATTSLIEILGTEIFLTASFLLSATCLF